MKILRLVHYISTSCIFIMLLSFSSTTFAKRPTPPPPEPDPIPIPVGTTSLISKASDATQGNNQSYRPEITPDGRYVLFSSAANNLVANDNNAQYDVFVHDNVTGITERVSLANDGSEADDESSDASISADGRYVAFTSSASNLVEGEQTHYDQAYLRDRINGTTKRISVAADGTLANAPIFSTSINADGRYVALGSPASNLVTNDTNGYTGDIFVYDQLSDSIERISVASDGSEANHRSALPTISADGQTLAFLSTASNLVAGDTNNVMDIFVHNRVTGITERVSIASDGTEANSWSGGPSISANGMVVTYTSTASNLVSGDTNNFTDAFVHDRITGITERVSVSHDGRQGNDDSFSGSLSADGRYVVFFTYANSLDMFGTFANWWYSDVFLFDRVTQTIEQISITRDGSQPSGDSTYPVISADGQFVAFESFASDVLPDDNGLYTNDIFLRDRNP